MTNREEPILTMTGYIQGWSAFQLLITLYIAFFVPEKDPELVAILAAEKEAKKAAKKKDQEK